jgi:excisionase family DNA binding protein
MSAETTVLAIEHVVKTPGVCGGAPRIAGRRITVHFIVTLIERLGASVEEVVEDYDLRSGQVYAALAYYHDNQREIDALITEVERLSESATSEMLALAQSRLQTRKVDSLDQMTVAEVAKEYGIKPVTVRRAIYDKRIAARKSGGTWLIRHADAEARWGHRRK